MEIHWYNKENIESTLLFYAFIPSKKAYKLTCGWFYLSGAFCMSTNTSVIIDESNISSTIQIKKSIMII